MRIIVVSAVNLRSGGPLSVLKDSLRVLNDEFSASYKVIALVHKKEMFEEFKKIEFVEFPNSIGSYFYRIYLEYFYFKKLSKQLKPYLWFSLHDITPNVEAEVRAVYCHNATPFYKTTLADLFRDPKIFLFSKFYKFLYAINIRKNNFVVVQQEWIANEFKKNYSVDDIVVAKPEVPEFLVNKSGDVKADTFTFFYPSFPRSFKNFEVVCQASKILNERGVNNFQAVLTIDGFENNYSKKILKSYKHINSISFVGLLSREEVFKYYSIADTLIFPSKLETWGLPISEFQATHKPLLVSDLPYAYETVGNYEKVAFFDPLNAEELAQLMQDSIEGKIVYTGNHLQLSNDLHTKNWQELFAVLLNLET
ncbi:glycosyltransferase [Pseudomonas sediminis]|uniref:glycosyltransferase n=1 Tax=Pseudomonas sediminis TaxID=1691904 RepID=UPI00244AD3BC|nr:glycosyltransferase [Pseudomonas sediminis]MDG9758565.1 glycosyltransferase [Pseudomonas sediminis]